MRKRGLIAAGITALVVLLDQLTKLWVIKAIPLYEKRQFLPGLMSFTHTENTGVSFGMLADYRVPVLIVTSISLIGMALVLVLYKKQHPLLTVSLSMVLGGGLGNLIDRVFRHAVVDFLEFDFVNFAIFNVADSFISIGAVLMFVYVIFLDAKHTRENQQNG